MRKFKQVKGFNMNKKTGHVSYAYRQNKDMVSSLGFTHNPDEKYSKKSKLKYNINPYDNSPCYVKTKVEVQHFNKYKYKPEYSNYRFHDEDKPLISKLIKRNKKRR